MEKVTKTDQEDVFKNVPVPAALRIMVVPAVISQLIVLIYNMADTFYVGHFMWDRRIIPIWWQLHR